MSRFLDTSGQPTYGVAICGRCSRKFPIGELQSDPNYPALMVCLDDVDDHDPYRLAARPSETALLPFQRPDDALTV
jgi:hypothetical protein